MIKWQSSFERGIPLTRVNRLNTTPLWLSFTTGDSQQSNHNVNFPLIIPLKSQMFSPLRRHWKERAIPFDLDFGQCVGQLWLVSAAICIFTNSGSAICHAVLVCAHCVTALMLLAGLCLRCKFELDMSYAAVLLIIPAHFRLSVSLCVESVSLRLSFVRLAVVYEAGFAGWRND